MFYLFIWLDVLHLKYKHSALCTSPEDKGNSAYCQSTCAHNINRYKPIEISIESSLNTDAQARDRTLNFLLTRTTP